MHTKKSQQQDTQGSLPESAELAAANQKIRELTEAGKRALADLANYKKRVEEERGAFAKLANVGLILELLPVVDNFHRAIEHTPEELKKNEWVKGMLAIEKQLADILKKQGVSEMPDPKGQAFDPHKHEAVMQAPGEKDTVVGVMEKGYLLGDKILRPAKVQVGNGNK